jgi:hypothetical protein
MVLLDSKEKLIKEKRYAQLGDVFYKILAVARQ